MRTSGLLPRKSQFLQNTKAIFLVSYCISIKKMSRRARTYMRHLFNMVVSPVAMISYGSQKSSTSEKTFKISVYFRHLKISSIWLCWSFSKGKLLSKRKNRSTSCASSSSSSTCASMLFLRRWVAIGYMFTGLTYLSFPIAEVFALNPYQGPEVVIL